MHCSRIVCSIYKIGQYFCNANFVNITIQRRKKCFLIKIWIKIKKYLLTSCDRYNILPPKNIQLFQLLTCDWILETRTQLWESEYMTVDDDGYYQVPGDVLEKFQKDLNSLRSIVEDIPVNMPWTSSFRIKINTKIITNPFFGILRIERSITDLLIRSCLSSNGRCFTRSHTTTLRS